MLPRLALSTRRVLASRPAPLSRNIFSSAAQQAFRPRKTTLGRRTAFAAFTAVSALVLLQTRSSVLLDASPQSAEEVRIDPDTKLEFPETLVVPSRVRLPPFTLVGLGVRKVSFIGIKVYSVGFYADLSNPDLKIPEDATPEEKLDYIVSNSACALRIIPTRSTSYTHLRDGFLRALQARMSMQLKSGKLSPQEAEEAQSPLRKLKSVFPNSPLAKGAPLDILLSAPPKKQGERRTLIIRDLGAVESDWVAKEFVMAYFEGDGLSPPMKKSAVEYLQGSKKAVAS